MDGDRTVTVNYFTPNYPPTLDAISDLTIPEDAGLQMVTLTGISAGDAGQTVTVTAVSSNPALVPIDLDHLEVSPTNPDTSANLHVTPLANAFGSATITVTVTDDGPALYNSTVRTFLVTVAPLNDPPTLNVISDLPIPEDPGVQTVPLTGITPGPGGESQPLTVTPPFGSTVMSFSETAFNVPTSDCGDGCGSPPSGTGRT